ncbi:hypothetical protein AVEN_151861-1 [Araneus ventricosus]|uniref:Uncharacterized protein n=1 Tax=Araneus ventricosus TaxID=182803 RepID=A0A4Y2JJS7_ARAVE|nr:hypothetical protein AVEN_151861-1 [Araneus ventricosus]
MDYSLVEVIEDLDLQPEKPLTLKGKEPQWLAEADSTYRIDGDSYSKAAYMALKPSEERMLMTYRPYTSLLNDIVETSIYTLLIIRSTSAAGV